MTTPPPSRKNSTGHAYNNNNIINVNSQQIQAVAVAAAVKVAAQQAAAALAATTATTTTTTSNSSEQYSSSELQPKSSIDDNQIQRSSSHDSHLRNKIVSTPSNNKQNINNINDYCGEHKLQTKTNSTATTPNSETNNGSGWLNSVSTMNKMNELTRRPSIEGSDCSSRGPSGFYVSLLCALFCLYYIIKK